MSADGHHMRGNGTARQCSEVVVNVVELEFLMTREAGILLRKKRVEKRLTQKQAASALGVAQPTISRLEVVPGQCRLATVLKAMKLFDVRWEDVRTCASLQGGDEIRRGPRASEVMAKASGAIAESLSPL